MHRARRPPPQFSTALSCCFILLRFAEHDVTTLTDAAERGVPLDVVDVRDPHAMLSTNGNLVLVRPDQHVAWRGVAAPADPPHVIDRVRGAQN